MYIVILHYTTEPAYSLYYGSFSSRDEAEIFMLKHQSVSVSVNDECEYKIRYLFQPDRIAGKDVLTAKTMKRAKEAGMI